MSRLFNGSTQYLEINQAVVTAPPLTMFCWFYPTTTGGASTLMSIVDASVDQHWFAMWTFTSDGVLVYARAGGSGGFAETTNAYTQNAWNSACCTFTSSTSRRAYLNGDTVNAVTNTDSHIPAGLDRTSIGRMGDTSPGTLFTGRIAEAIIFNRALSDGEVVDLHNCRDVFNYDPSARVAYWPLFGVHSPEIDLSGGGYSMALTASPTQAAHAPVKPMFWTPPQFTEVPAAAATTILPQMMQHYYGGPS